MLTFITPNLAFSKLASDEQIERTAQALETNGIHTLVAQTLEKLGILEGLARYDSVRAKLSKMDDKTQHREMVKLGATPEYILGSVHAVTEDGHVLIASMSGSQLAPYAAAAAKVIWVVGAQKPVKDFNEAMRRIEEYAYPLEDQRAQQSYGVHSGVNKALIVNKEISPDRITMIIVKENLGF
ncbi:MAG: LUD domain-containing protein [Chloroflexi bacterium]|nr:LUD domain-containing protein [Chloroflexota bacterium]